MKNYEFSFPAFFFFFYFILINFEEENQECDLSECVSLLFREKERNPKQIKKSWLFQIINSIFEVVRMFESRQLFPHNRNSPVFIFTELMQKTNFS